MEKVFVFDLGNVIVIPMNTKKLYEMLECKISYEEFRNYFKNDKSAGDIHKGIITTEEYIDKMIEFTGSNKTRDEYISIFTGSIRNGLFKDTVEIIDKLKKNNQKICMLSNLRKLDFEWFETQYDINNFDKLYLSYEMHLVKPNKDIYEKMIKDLNTEVENIYFFDDNQENVNIAKELGINAYCVTGDSIKNVFLDEKLID